MAGGGWWWLHLNIYTTAAADCLDLSSLSICMYCSDAVQYISGAHLRPQGNVYIFLLTYLPSTSTYVILLALNLLDLSLMSEVRVA